MQNRYTNQLRCPHVLLNLACSGHEPSHCSNRNEHQSDWPVGAKNTSGSLIGIQYEHWFNGPESWKSAEAIPLLGKYTTDEATVAKHYAEFQDLGIDWLLIDWSNELWMKPAWEEQTDETKQFEDKTAVLFKTALDLHRQGKYAPKLVFMLGLQEDGPPIPNGVQRLNGILSWLKTNYLDRPEYKDLWLYDGGKPLLTILYWPRDPCTQLQKDLAASPFHAEPWTIRWMTSQLQDNHSERCGFWSWMDGVIPQVLTKRDGKAEEIVVTPSAFMMPAMVGQLPSTSQEITACPISKAGKPPSRRGRSPSRCISGTNLPDSKTARESARLLGRHSRTSNSTLE